MGKNAYFPAILLQQKFYWQSKSNIIPNRRILHM